jgi:hypothetical protein
MTAEMTKEPAHSLEFEIDATVEDLLGKLITDVLTPMEEARYNQLLAQRSRMMRPTFLGRARRRVLA